MFGRVFVSVGGGTMVGMRGPVDTLAAGVAVVGEAWAGALPPFGVTDGDPSVLVGQFSDPGLLAVVRAVGAVIRQAESLSAVLAAEVARRSPVGQRSGNLARSAGHASPGSLVAASRGGQIGRAIDLVKVGEGTAARRTLQGEPLPAVHPHVAAGLYAGTISVDVAHLIITMLERVAPGANPIELESTEAMLADQATRFTYRQMVRLVGHAAEWLDPCGKEPREEAQRTARSVTMSQDPSGMFHLKGTLDPESGARIKTALDAYVSARLRETRGSNHPGRPGCGSGHHDSGAADGHSENGGHAEVDAVPEGWEVRSIAQLQADALADFARHILACDTTTPWSRR